VTQWPATPNLGDVNYWLVKQEPEDYSWAAFVKDRSTAWTGVRNFQARNHLRAMTKGDLVFYYHSGTDRQVVGIAKVAKAPYPDPTATEGEWVCVDLAAVKPLKEAVGLDVIKADRTLKEMSLVKQGRLSVNAVTHEQFRRILELSKTEAPV